MRAQDKSSAITALTVAAIALSAAAASTAFGSLAGPQNLPPYEYVRDGALAQSCKLLLAGKGSEADWQLCKRYMQGFMDAKLTEPETSGKYCVPDRFKVEDAIKAYIETTDGFRGTSLYFEATPASRSVNRWFNKFFACQIDKDAPE